MRWAVRWMGPSEKGTTPSPSLSPVPGARDGRWVCDTEGGKDVLPRPRNGGEGWGEGGWPMDLLLTALGINHPVSTP
jgi:hypothetical protein